MARRKLDARKGRNVNYVEKYGIYEGKVVLRQGHPDCAR